MILCNLNDYTRFLVLIICEMSEIELTSLGYGILCLIYCRRHNLHKHLRDVEINYEDASKPVARHFNLPNHSQKHMAVCGFSLHLDNSESRKNMERKFCYVVVL